MTDHNVKWIVDKYMFDDHITPEAFSDLGIEFYEIGYVPFLKDYNPPYNKDECIITYGTINSIRYLKEYYGTFFREENFKYNVYSSNYCASSYFLNHDHFFVTYDFLRHNSKEVYDKIGKNSIFIRPNNGNKSFTGKVIPKRDLELEMECLKKLHNISNEELILISTPKQILEESRFIIVGNELIAYSRYQINGMHREDRNTSQECINLANHLLMQQSWTPEEIFTLDIALTPDGPRIIELNSFSCSGWYDCDPKIVIDKVSKFVQDMWKEQY